MQLQTIWKLIKVKKKQAYIRFMQPHSPPKTARVVALLVIFWGVSILAICALYVQGAAVIAQRTTITHYNQQFDGVFIETFGSNFSNGGTYICALLTLPLSLLHMFFSELAPCDTLWTCASTACQLAEVPGIVYTLIRFNFVGCVPFDPTWKSVMDNSYYRRGWQIGVAALCVALLSAVWVLKMSSCMGANSSSITEFKY